MSTFLEVQKKLVPDLLQIMQKRYEILRSIWLSGLVGRRTLAQALGLTERVLRSEVEFLKKQNLIDIRPTGMVITEEGKKILLEMEDMMREISGINQMEKRIKEHFQLQAVYIVPGNSDHSPWVKKEMGRACAKSIKKRLLGKNIIAVTGGTTMAAVAETLTPDFSNKQIVFVPARGGIGEDVSNQANVICAKMAKNTGQKYRVFYAPDQVSQQVYASLMKEESIREILALISSANMVLHGIGDAMVMAKRRNTSPEDMEKLVEVKAVAEAFGYYFNEEGQVVHKVSTIGLQLSDLSKAKDVIAVAGGASKGKAIFAYLKSAPKSTVLITDEAAAKMLLKGI